MSYRETYICDKCETEVHGASGKQMAWHIVDAPYRFGPDRMKQAEHLLCCDCFKLFLDWLHA